MGGVMKHGVRSTLTALFALFVVCGFAHADQVIYTYDNLNRLTEASSTDAVASLSTHVSYVYDNGGNTTTQTVAVNVLIPDAGLLNAVCSALGKEPSCSLTPADMADLTILSASGMGISSLTGLAWATNLTSADLRNNNITSVDPLRGLTNLTNLRLSGNPAASAVGKWTGMGPPVPQPYGPSTVTINGLVYLFDVHQSGEMFVANDLWRFDPSTSSWTRLSPAGTPPPGISGQTAVAIDGKMYVFGGFDQSFGYNGLWAYDPSAGPQGTWTHLSPTGDSLPATSSRSAVAIDGKMYVCGGYDSSLNDLFVYDPSDNTWTQLSPTGGPPSARYQHSAAVIAGKMYVFGGVDRAGGVDTDMNDLWVYDPSANTWVPLSPAGEPPQPRASHSAVAIDGKMYVFGGDRSHGSVYNDLWTYDPSIGLQGTWTQLSPSTSPTPRSDHAAAAVGNEMYVFGGWGQSRSYSSDVWYYDTSAGVWTRLQFGLQGRYGQSASIVGEKAYVFGGESYDPATDQSLCLDDLWSYDMGTGLWESLSPSGTKPAARYLHSSVTINNQIYVFGGESYSGQSFYDLWVYDPTTNAWTQLSPSGGPPGARYDHSAAVIAGKMYVFGGRSSRYTAINDCGSMIPRPRPGPSSRPREDRQARDTAIVPPS
jgi:N-acetylneuraminic acid mutarotase